MRIQNAEKRLYDKTLLIGGFRRRRAIKALARSHDPEGVVALAGALGNGHPNAKRISKLLLKLSAERDADKVRAIWIAWAHSPTAPVATLFERLGWPPANTADPRTIRDILGAANSGVPPGILRAVIVFARSLPIQDESGNDAIYAAWLRTQSAELEKLITDEDRQPGNPALEALHALVTGHLERYARLKDADGLLLVQAFSMAPESFRARIAQTVAASPDRNLKAAYRRAVTGSDHDAGRSLENLKLVGDEDGLFEMTRSLRLVEVLDLCERWAGITAGPSGARQRGVVERAVTSYRGLGEFKVEPSPELPEGLVDIFDWWRSQKPSDGQLRADLDAPDPFQKARGLYLGHERGFVDAARIEAAANSEHWPERLIARMVDPAVPAQAEEDHVLWVSACAGDGALLNAAIGGTPENYAHNTDLLGKARGPAAARTRALLEILCAFQGAFVASGITVDESTEATDRHAVEIDDADPVDF